MPVRACLSVQFVFPAGVKPRVVYQEGVLNGRPWPLLPILGWP